MLPWVAGLLWPASLQLLHQHLAAPPQSVTNLPEGATATQRPVTILTKTEKNPKQNSILWRHLILRRSAVNIQTSLNACAVHNKLYTDIIVELQVG